MKIFYKCDNCDNLRNWLPWINSQVWRMLHARSTAFKSGNESHHSSQEAVQREVGRLLLFCRLRADVARPAADHRIQEHHQHHQLLICLMTSSVSTPSSRPPVTSQREVTTPGPPNPLPLLHQQYPQSRYSKPWRGSTGISKAAEPVNIPGRALRTCANELTDVQPIFNLSLIQSTIPSCLKTTTIVPLPKKSPPACLNDYRTVALTPIIMKCFESVILAYIQSTTLLLLPSTTPSPT